MADTPLDTIVLGIDGSVASASALRWAAERVPGGGSIELVNASGRSASADDGKRLLDEQRDAIEVPHDVVIELHVASGEPAEVLLDVARGCDASLIVVGAHGAGGAGSRSPFLGSVARALLHRSSLPLIIHNQAGDTDDGAVIGCMGYGPPAEAAAEWAADYAAARGRPLELLHAVSHRPLYPLDSPIDMLASYLGSETDMEWATEDLDATAADLGRRHPGIEVTTKTVRGSTVRAILEAGSGSGVGPAAEIVVLGRPVGHAATHLPVSPRVHQVIARAQWPTAVVPSCVKPG